MCWSALPAGRFRREERGSSRPEPAAPGRRVKIFFDGGCRPNPGLLHTAVVAGGRTWLHGLDGELGEGDNNEAEWLAALHALEIAASMALLDVILLGDSAVVVNQARGIAPCRSARLREKLAAFHVLKAGFDRVRLRRINRSQNLAGIALERLHGKL